MADTKIQVTFSTSAGDLTDDLPANQPLHSLKREVMGRLKLDPSQADQFVVTLEGSILDESKSLSQLNVQTGAVLVIDRKDVVKI